MKTFSKYIALFAATCLAATPALAQQQGPFGPGPAPSTGGSGLSGLTTNGVVIAASGTTAASTSVGSTGQCLQGNTAAAPTYSACPSSPIAAPAVSGNWYQPPFLVEANGTAATAGRMVCTEQVNIITGLTVKGLAVRTIAAGTSNTQLAIYANSGGFPNGAPLGSTGNLLNTSANTNIGTPGDVTNFSLPVGPYWACVVSNDSTVDFLSSSPGSVGAGTSALIGSATLANVLFTAGVQIVKVQTITFGTFPTATSTGWTENSVTSQSAVILLQAN